MKILPKSLHTVRVLVLLALAEFERDTSQSVESCVASALNLLGYEHAAGTLRGGNHIVDPYALGAKAVAQVKAQLTGWQPEDHEIVPTGSTFDTEPHAVMASHIRRHPEDYCHD